MAASAAGGPTRSNDSVATVHAPTRGRCDSSRTGGHATIRVHGTDPESPGASCALTLATRRRPRSAPTCRSTVTTSSKLQSERHRPSNPSALTGSPTRASPTVRASASTARRSESTSARPISSRRRSKPPRVTVTITGASIGRLRNRVPERARAGRSPRRSTTRPVAALRIRPSSVSGQMARSMSTRAPEHKIIVDVTGVFTSADRATSGRFVLADPRAGFWTAANPAQPSVAWPPAQPATIPLPSSVPSDATAGRRQHHQHRGATARLPQRVPRRRRRARHVVPQRRWQRLTGSPQP